jgi:hypothetical protein
MRPAAQGGIEYVRDVLANPAQAQLLPAAPVARPAASGVVAGAPAAPAAPANDGSRP